MLKLRMAGLPVGVALLGTQAGAVEPRAMIGEALAGREVSIAFHSNSGPYWPASMGPRTIRPQVEEVSWLVPRFLTVGPSIDRLVSELA